MYRVVLLMDDDELENKLRSLIIWGDASCFEIAGCVSHIDACKLSGYDLIIADEKMGLELLHHAKLKRKHLRVVLCSSSKDFESARRGIVLKAYDYITLPFDLPRIHTMLSRAEAELRVGEVEDMIALEQLKDYFHERDSDFYGYFESILNKFLSSSEDLARSTEKLKAFYGSIWRELSEQHAWLDLYTDEVFVYPDRPLTDRESFDLSASMISELFRDICELYPHHSVQLEDVINTILNYPESDLRQKTLSTQLHINNTYLSTFFLAQTGIRFVEYVNTVKLKRAAWLLSNTDLGITEIALRLDYKDNSYFSKLFRQKYGLAPSNYRMPPSYDFQI